MNKLPSYKPSACCGGNVDCDLLGMYEDQPCWGNVEGYYMEMGEESYSGHLCVGHYGFQDGNLYLKSLEGASLNVFH